MPVVLMRGTWGRDCRESWHTYRKGWVPLQIVLIVLTSKVSLTHHLERVVVASLQLKSHIWSKASGLLVSFQMSWPLLLHNPSGCQLEPNLMSLDIGMKQHQQPLNCFLCSIRCKCIFSSLPGLHLMVSRIHSLRVRSFQKWPLPEEGERPVVAWQFFFPILHQEITQEMSASLNICQQNEVHEPLLFPQMTCNQVFFSQKSIKTQKTIDS